MSRRNEGKLRVGTRGSRLALTQTDLAIRALEAAAARPLAVEVVRIRTIGDRVADRPFSEIGAKGVFAGELQGALAAGEIDVAVHSLKDLTADEPAGLVIAAVLERSEGRDAFVSSVALSLAELPAGSTVGTSSARRTALLGVVRPDLRAVPLRGNVDTRLRKVADGEVDAAVLAGAGLVRLDRTDAIREWLDPSVFVPPPGQGAVALEVRADDLEGDLGWLAEADHAPTRAAVDAERTFMGLMEGGCTVPLGAWARFEDGRLVCDGFVASSDGAEHVRGSVSGADPVAVGSELAGRLRDAGAARLIGR